MKSASQRCRDAAHFIYDLGELPQLQLAGVALRASFSVAEYSDALFEVLGIAFPENLRRAVAKRKAEFLCGRFLAALALERLGGPRTDIGVGEHRQPLWPAAFSGSLSHSNDRVGCILSTDPTLGLGIDIENVMSDAAARKLANTVVAEDEWALLESQAAGFGWGFTAVFSAKETLFKALYPRVRRYFDFSAARVIELHWQQARLMLELTQDLACYRCSQRFEIELAREDNRVWTFLVHGH